MTSRWRTVWATGESDDRIVRLGMAGPGVVVSADNGGALQARRVDDGSLVAAPTYTGITGIVALATWRDGTGVRAATGAGSIHRGYRWLQRWNLDAGKEIPPAIDMNRPQVKNVDPAVVRGEHVLVVINRGVFEIRRATDGSIIGEVAKNRETTRVAIGSSGGRPIAVASSRTLPPELFWLDDLAPPVPLPGLAGEFVEVMDGDRLVCGSYAEPWNAWKTAWAGDLSGRRLGPAVTGDVITSVVIAAWPAVYIARADCTVSLIDLASGDELCPALRLPTKASGIAATPGGDLIAGYGLHVARYRPPR